MKSSPSRKSGAAERARVTREKQCRQRGNLVLAFAERRQAQRRGADSIEQVTPERAALHFAADIGVRRGDDANRRRDGARLTDGVNLTAFEKPQ